MTVGSSVVRRASCVLAESTGGAALLSCLQRLDADAHYEPVAQPRHCTNSACLCGHFVVLNGHRINAGHVRLDGEALDVSKVCARLASTPCCCCKHSKPRKSVDRGGGSRHCHYCGSTAHLRRDCSFGESLERSQQFLRCDTGGCFVRRIVVPLHRARTDFSLDDLLLGRVDVAARLMTSALVCSQRLRHNTELWLSFLGDDAAPTSVCVTGGLVRHLHPAESANAARLRRALDELLPGLPAAELAHAKRDFDLRGFRILRCGLDGALAEALALARGGGVQAPLLLLVQGAPPLAQVLGEMSRGGSLEEVVVLLGDDVGLSDAEASHAEAVAGAGAPIWRASVGAGCLLASQCVVLLHHYLDQLHECPERLWAPPSEADARAAWQLKRRAKRQAARGRVLPEPAEAQTRLAEV